MSKYALCSACRKGVWLDDFIRPDLPYWVHPSRMKAGCRQAMRDWNVLPDPRHP